MPKKCNIPSVSFTKNGVFIHYGDGEEQRIGEPIHVLALGLGLQDELSYTVLELRDRDKRWRKAVLRSSLLTARTTDFKEQLTDVYNYQLPSRSYVSLVIDALATKNPRRRIPVTVVPGWQGKRYVHPREIIKRDGDDCECLLAYNPNVQLGEFHCRGTLDEWRKGIAHYCPLSSRLRLAVGVPFAAIVLRLLSLPTFGFHLVGTTSSGKTLCLRVASSVPGFNSEAGVTSWDGTSTGLEQLALGRRDNLVTLDETGGIEGDDRKTANFIQLTAFRFANNRQKHRAGHYSHRHTVDSDLRSIVLSTGEDVLPVDHRLRGRDVRLIQVPACVSADDDIFDAEHASAKIGQTVHEREKFVTQLEASTRQFQGIAQLEFLRRLVNDVNAEKKLKAAVDEFISRASIPESRFTGALARIRRNIAAVYAAMALAIEYGILPFSKEATLRDLRQCMKDAINLLIKNQMSGYTAPSLSDDELIAQFRKQLIAAKFISAGAYANRTRSLTAEQIEAADGFINFVKPEKYRVMLQTRLMRAWFPDERTRNRLVSLLRNQRMILAGRQADASSRQVSLRPYPHKIPVYWLSLKTLGLKLEELHVN